MKYLVFCFCFAVTGIGFAADMSSLHVSLITFDVGGALSKKSNVQLMVTDPSGKMTGENPWTGESKGEIGNSSYSAEALGELRENGDSANDEDVSPGPERFSFEMGPVPAGEYAVRVFAVGDTRYSLNIRLNDAEHKLKTVGFDGYVSSGMTRNYKVAIDPAPSSSVPNIFKTVTFEVILDDMQVAQKFAELGEEKFQRELLKNIRLAEKLADVCEKREADAAKGCEPAVDLLKLFVKRLELANRKCDDPAACGEEKLLGEFRKEHAKDRAYDEFLKQLDKDGKAKEKRFVTDEALAIIKGDAELLIAKLSGEPGPKKKSDKR